MPIAEERLHAVDDDALHHVVDWVLGPGKDYRLRRLIPGFCERLREAGVPVTRCTVHIRQVHPQFYSRGFIWNEGDVRAIELPREHGIEKTTTYLNSPLFRIYEFGETIRRRIGHGIAPPDFPILEELETAGATDYTAIGLPFRRGTGQAITFATHDPKGFSDANLALIHAALPAFAAVAELVNLERMMRVLLETYIGESTGARVMAGEIRRGEVSRIRAVLLFSDLRGFTALSETVPGEVLLNLLNESFQTLSEPFTAVGGEILKFIGDAMLIILPVDGDGERNVRKACEVALAAAETAQSAMAVNNASRRRRGEPLLEAGLALHLGEVLYGNVGTRERLDFTVIGPAVNLVSRMEHLCAELGRPMVVSSDFAAGLATPMQSLGRHELRGVGTPQEIFVPL